MTFAEYMEDVLGQDNSWIDRMLGYPTLPDGFQDFLNTLKSGLFGVFDCIGLCIDFFLKTPALTLLLCFSAAYGSFNFLKRAFNITKL